MLLIVNIFGLKQILKTLCYGSKQHLHTILKGP